MRKLLLIDYREKRIAKHQCLEIECNEDIEDRFVVAACHRYIGLNNEMDCVSDEYDRCMNALIELEHAAFMAGASMVRDFISGKEM